MIENLVGVTLMTSFSFISISFSWNRTGKLHIDRTRAATKTSDISNDRGSGCRHFNVDIFLINVGMEPELNRHRIKKNNQIINIK
jgi:hypothetical protein